ncbi:MAG TPA: hypothetical protein DD392_06890, partial [Ruminococcus sp.]|nr:hypothetical protein [Ruminococcus sp.]
MNSIDTEKLIYDIKVWWEQVSESFKNGFSSFKESIGDIMFPENLTIAAALILMVMTTVFIFSKAIKENITERKKINGIN